jgi:hypothetical protein
MHPTLKPGILAPIESKILADKKSTGRTDMDLWQILVLGVVCLGLEVDSCVLKTDAQFPTGLNRLFAFLELL